MKNVIKVIGLSTFFMLAHASPSGSTLDEIIESSSLLQKLGKTGESDYYRIALLVKTLASPAKGEKTLQELRIRDLKKAAELLDGRVLLELMEPYPSKMLSVEPLG